MPSDKDSCRACNNTETEPTNVSSAAPTDSKCEALLCPHGNPWCQNRACRNPNCGVGKRARKTKVTAPRESDATSTLRAMTPASAATTGPLQMRSAKRYPLSYPRRHVCAGDGENTKECGMRICEFHNYDPKGCRKGAAGTCPLSHRFCHFCYAEGHRALECEAQLAADARVLEAMAVKE